MAKRYKTSGRTLGNFRGRTGSLMLIPSRKAQGPSKPFVVAETFGIACGVLAADADPCVVSIDSEPAIPLDSVPSGQVHLDLRLAKQDGTRHFIEVRDEKFVTEEGLRRLKEADHRISSWGDSFEFQLRSDAVASAEAKGLQFLHRYRNSAKPQTHELDAASEVIAAWHVARLTEWLEQFRLHSLPARVLYWCIAHRLLSLCDGDLLFPNGRLIRSAGPKVGAALATTTIRDRPGATTS